MQRAFRIVKLIFLGISILLCLAIPVVGLISTAISWEGVCESASGLYACPWWQFAGNEMLWTSFLFIPLLFAAAIIWLVMSAVQFVIAMAKKRKEKAVLSTGDERG
jgi:hypothetical protein